jgi:predicted O-methyltransferase YrrM
LDVQLLDEVSRLAGALRGRTFRAAAKFVLRYRPRRLIETGCFRGIVEDGCSTLILARLKKELGQETIFESYEKAPEHVARAQRLVAEHGLGGQVTFIVGDSVENIGRSTPDKVGFAYLDSYDFEERDPLPSQRHQLAEAGAILGRMSEVSAILLDDCALPHGGKGGMAIPFLLEHGWKIVLQEYQTLLVRM